MRRLALALLVFAPLALTAQRSGVLRLGTVAEGPRRYLDATWEDDTGARERTGCVTAWSARSRPAQGGVDSIYAVTEIAVSRTGETGRVRGVCRAGVPEFHTHPPTTCVPGTSACMVGGDDAWVCTPSREDYARLEARHDPFAVLQCDRNAFRFYFPAEAP